MDKTVSSPPLPILYELQPLLDVFKAAGQNWQTDAAVQAELLRQRLYVFGCEPFGRGYFATLGSLDTYDRRVYISAYTGNVSEIFANCDVGEAIRIQYKITADNAISWAVYVTKRDVYDISTISQLMTALHWAIEAVAKSNTPKAEDKN